jgi:exopolysaccharide biosynthesis polyprenyl glycosylphosphotransferase
MHRGRSDTNRSGVRLWNESIASQLCPPAASVSRQQCVRKPLGGNRAPFAYGPLFRGLVEGSDDRVPFLMMGLLTGHAVHPDVESETGKPGTIQVTEALRPTEVHSPPACDTATALASDSKPLPSSWRLPGRAGSATAVLLVADSTVLAGYLLAQPIWWRAYVGLWLITVMSFQSKGGYRPRLFLSVLDDLPKLLRRAMPAVLLVGVVVGRLRGPDAVGTYVLVALVGVAGHLLARGIAYAGIRWARRSGRVGYRTLVVGGGEVSHRLVTNLDADGAYGLRVLGYVDDEPSPLPAGSAGWVRLVTVSDLATAIRRLRVDVLVVGDGPFASSHVAGVLRTMQGRTPTVFVVPRLFELGVCSALPDRVGAVPVVRLQPSRLNGMRWRLKRAFDLVVSALALLALAPLMASVAVAVRLEGGRGVIFRQVRVGRHGQLFEVLKFRSMRPADPSEADVRWSIVDDDRVGPVGRFIRRTSLDELPQLFNVLRGEMTIVGPRPERPHFVEQFSGELPHYPHRHRAPVGLTGLAQVSGLRGDTSIDERARYDNYYIESWSLWLDIKVIFRTIRQVLRAAGA